MKKALITGVTGQDGSYLAEFLLEKGYEVYGLYRRGSTNTLERIEHLLKDNKIKLLHGDMTDSLSVVRIIREVEPDEIYNLAAQSHVAVSFDSPEYTSNVNGLGILRILEAVRILGLEKKTRIYQASTSELYGKVLDHTSALSETTQFDPFSPYGIAKLYGFWIVKNYREAHNLFAVNGILFNHESERRGETFVTRKISLGAARVSKGYQEKLSLGNLDSVRDWGYAKDYVEAMWLMLQQDEPEDFVIATGEKRTVREFATLAFKFAGIDIEWKNSGMDEVGIDKKTGKVVVDVDKRFFRPSDVDYLLGDPSKAKQKLGFNPRKTSFENLVKIMVEHDLQLIENSTKTIQSFE